MTASWSPNRSVRPTAPADRTSRLRCGRVPMSQFRLGTERITQHESQMRFQRQPAWEKIVTAASSPSNGNCQPQLNTVSTYQSATLVLLRKRALSGTHTSSVWQPSPTPTPDRDRRHRPMPIGGAGARPCLRLRLCANGGLRSVLCAQRRGGLSSSGVACAT